jgi:hypothetical protein
MPIKPKVETTLPNRQPTLTEIAQLVEGASHTEHMAILESGASFAEIEQALLRFSGDDDVLGEAPPPLEGRSAQVYEILRSFEAADEES